jgi:polyhydroxyalkanoate synthesis regulator phasin
LNNKVNSLSDEDLRAWLNDPSLTWEQRKAVMNELVEGAKENLPDDYSRKNVTERLDELYQQYKDGKLRWADADELAKRLGVTTDQLYKRPPGSEKGEYA